MKHDSTLNHVLSKNACIDSGRCAMGNCMVQLPYWLSQMKLGHGVAWLTSRQAHHIIYQHNCKGCISWLLSWVMPGQGMGLLTQNVIDAKIAMCYMWVLLQAACVQRHTTCGVHVWCSQMLQLRQSVRTCRQSHGAAAL